MYKLEHVRLEKLRIKRETEQRERYCEIMDLLRQSIFNRLITTEIDSDSSSDEGKDNFVSKSTRKRMQKLAE